MLNPDPLTLPSLARAVAERWPSKPAFSLLSEDSSGDSMNWYSFSRRVAGLASVLVREGIQEGERVILLAENSPAWPVAYFAISTAGAVIVPILVDFVPEQIQNIISHSGAKMAFVSAKTRDKIPEELRDDMKIFLIDTMNADSIELAGAKGPRKELFRALSSYTERHPDDLASILYTSGTSGQSKGVMLSHRNLLFDAQACRSIIKIYPRDRFLSILPLAHSYECTIGMLIATVNGASTVYLDRPPTPAVLLPALKVVKPTIMLSVPLIMEKIYRGKILPSLEKHPLYRLPLTRNLAIKAAGKKLYSTFGGAIRFFGIGGAALAPDVEAFLMKAGFPYAIGYGLTETAPLLAGAPPFKTVLRSTGPALEGVSLRIVDSEGKVLETPGAEGEIQAKGPNVMLGYYRDEERTAEAFTQDAWFKTGDLGSFDKKGRLFIKGRLKAMILGPSGENIYPEEIESLINETGFVEESLVYAGKGGEIVALVVLNEKAQTLLAAAGDVAHGAADAIGAAFHDVADRAGALLNKVKTDVNRRLGAFSRIHQIQIHQEPFEKTATRKIKRFLYPNQHMDQQG